MIFGIRLSSKSFVRDCRPLYFIIRTPSICSFGLILLVLILSLIYQKTALLIATIVYFIIVTILNLLKFTNKNNFNNKELNKTINVIKHILHYTFPIVLIVFGAISLEKVSSRAWLISLSVLAIIIRFIISSINTYK